MEKGDGRTYAIVGAAMEVHRELGPGFLEAVYQQALALELAEREIPFLREVDLPVFYKARQLNTVYRADFICFASVVVELKAITALTRVEEAQIINYLRATRYEVGLLLNFPSSSLEYRRFVSSNKSAISA
ncbi:MAG TPA: GxxExxY protein [Candidatus Binataceae bacterium]|nr:GxxExxY protein [Candidatus Binataceae bacterium]